MLTRLVLLPNRTCTTPNSRKTRSAASSASHTREKARIRSLTVATECCFDAGNQRLREQQMEGDRTESGQACQGSYTVFFLLFSVVTWLLSWSLSCHIAPPRGFGRAAPVAKHFDFLASIPACGWSRTKTFIGSEAEPEKHGISLLARHVGKPIPTKPVLSAYTAKPYNPRAFSYAPTRSPLYRILGHVVPLPALLFPPQSLPLHPPVTLSSSTLLEHHSAYLHGALRAYAVAKEAPASKGHITDHVSSSRQ